MSTAAGDPDAPRVDRAQLRSTWNDAAFVPFWLDSPDAPEPAPPLRGDGACDLAVVGGGFMGLWAALLAKERDPAADVVLIEADRIGWQASGRNGGFAMSTLTHGIHNGESRWPGEIHDLERLGKQNLDAIEEAVQRYSIDCSWERTGELYVATQPWQVEAIKEEHAAHVAAGRVAQWFDRDAMQAEIASPTFLAGSWDSEACAMVDPARLAWGLARACREAGVRVHESTRATGLDHETASVTVTTAGGRLRARRVVLATNAFPALVAKARRRVVPVYDYALMTEPLTPEQRASLGWQRRQGLADAGNQFHYFRLSDDDRILWGGYDAVYYYGSAISPDRDTRPDTFDTLADHFFTTFPQLEGVRFTHAWGGVIDTCTRFCAFYGTALEGRVAYAMGYTGMGVASTRFGALVALDLLSGESTPLTGLEMVRSTPMAWPPEPLRAAAIGLTRRSIARADSHGGKRDLWLRTLDRFGLGFDS